MTVSSSLAHGFKTSQEKALLASKVCAVHENEGNVKDIMVLVLEGVLIGWLAFKHSMWDESCLWGKLRKNKRRSREGRGHCTEVKLSLGLDHTTKVAWKLSTSTLSIAG
jgi:hypothetical protein